MIAPINEAAWLVKAGTPLKVDTAPLLQAGPGEIVVKNAVVAINPLDCHMQDVGIFVQQWPTIFGCDVAGEVHQVGSDIDRFRKGDRVIARTINLNTGRPSDGAYAKYTVISADKAAKLPTTISYTNSVVLPFAIEAAVCALCVKEPSPCMPGVLTPALALPYPTLQTPSPLLATAAGINVIAIAGAHNFVLVKECDAAQVFDHKDTSVVARVIDAIKSSNAEFVGIFDAVSTPESYTRDLAILAEFDGGHLACVHPPPETVPVNVKAGMIWAVNDVATPVFRDFVTPALQNGSLRCLPRPTIVGNGLEFVNEGLKKCKAGVSGTKLVVTLDWGCWMVDALSCLAVGVVSVRSQNRG